MAFFAALLPLLFHTTVRFPSVLAISLPDAGLESRTLSPRISPNSSSDWTFVGCFTDISIARTLAASFTSDNTNMTVETCLAFCDAGDYIFSGLEFAQECYCDSTIQVPSTQAPTTDCSTPCTGNSSETCGGSSRIQIYTNGQAAPVIVQAVANSGWAYQGCFTDSAASRVLDTPVNVPAGVTAETCTEACQTAGFSNAGMEDGRECWCGDVLGNTTTHVSDEDCRAVCVSDHSEYCGNANRLALYHFFTNGTAPGSGPEKCTSTNLANFTLSAKFINPPQDGSSDVVPLKIILVEMVPSVTWSILSACTLCCSDWPTYSMQNSVFLPHSLTNPGQLMVSSAPGEGESPNFVASAPAFPGVEAYCAMDNPSGLISDPQILALSGEADAFSLCPNNTANRRLDVVFDPVTNHPHYVLDECSPVTIQIVSSD